MQLKKLSAYIYPQTIRARAKYSTDNKAIPQPVIRLSLLFHYLWYCLRYRTAIPWYFFQLNSNYFNEKKGIFSKLDIDGLIPEKWHLPQWLYSPTLFPPRYPVFIKPEWGQNSNGIVRIENADQYRNFAEQSSTLRMPYIVQEAAKGSKEFELYYLRSPDDFEDFAYFSITEVTNLSGERHPINSIHNGSTGYLEIGNQLSADERQQIWKMVRKIGAFRMARIGVKANDLADLTSGDFKIVEINLFLPLPLVLLADNVSRQEKKSIIKKTMIIAAKLVKTIPRHETRKWIFFRKMLAHYKTA